jgi:hypothetical protein
MMGFVRLFWATLREIFDEAAYDRYLARTGSMQSRESFAEFFETTKAARECRPRCC